MISRRHAWRRRAIRRDHVGGHGGESPAGNCLLETSISSWKGWDVTNDYLDGDAEHVYIALSGMNGGMSLGTLHDQKFFAMRANGDKLDFPFPERPFTALVDLSRSISDDNMRRYAQALMRHGCVQAVCRGEDSERMTSIFEELTETGEYDRDGKAATVMASYDETLVEAIQYFVLPCDLAKTGLLVVIGDNGDFQNAIDGFSTAAGAMKEAVVEKVYSETDLVCFVST